ncbi:Acetyl-CoA acetyltransferase [Micromonospora viridifaciens]|uniref:Acetyl-CoA acetyltransferase n=1 Tax=Micromonospora viridifaciens TaxID=1881 RepID=A0A1C4YW59_MICVI|nr:thiolase [Micromonospora viridifaciens]SCF24857.1 Acetyl-CoA acetyltransferase [Micromonospora viridifaciens]
MTDSLRGTAAVVGVAESQLGLVGPGLTPLDLMGQASHAALAEAGLTTRDVDGLFTASSIYPAAGLDTAEYLGIQPRYIDGTVVGGSSFVSHVLHAAAALRAGLCDVALVTYASNQRSNAGKLVARTQLNAYEAPYGPRFPVSMYALAAARHMHEFGTTREQLADVAVAAREWARLNPKAFSRDPLTRDDVINARMVSSPLTVRDCCLVTDGGGAVVLTRAERARDLPRPPVYLLGAGEATDHATISQMPDLTATSAVQSSRRAYDMAGLSASDIDVVQLYDAFTINPILFLEDLGFCAKGEGGAFVADGRIAPGGVLPVNTNGGGLSYCHPGMYGILLIIEAVRQLRGECGERQVSGARTALTHGNGGVLSSQVTAIFGTEATV